jgi:hypothetical protein
MRIKIFLKKLAAIGAAAIMAAVLVGCFDLGDFSDDAAYYDAFGEISLVYSTEKKEAEYKKYSVEDYFYNKATGEDFSYGNPKDEEPDGGKDIPQLPYVYMAIPVQQDMKIDSLALYFNAVEDCPIEVAFYLVNELPDGGSFSDIRLLEDPEYLPESNGNGEEEPEKIKYSDPDDSLMVAKTTLQAKGGNWVSLLVNDWSGENMLEVKEGQYVLLRFINNSGIYTGQNPFVSFRVTNLLIRAFF